MNRNKPLSIDVQDARAAVRWAEEQLGVHMDRFLRWEQTRPYALSLEPDATTGGSFLVARLLRPVDAVLVADVGAMLNSIRSSLDLLMAALARANGKAPDRTLFFPITETESAFDKATRRLVTDGWLTADQAGRLRALQAFRSGDPDLYALHWLDNRRKHERLVSVAPTIMQTWFSPVAGIEPHVVRLADRTILYRLPPGISVPAHPGNSNVGAALVFNEPAVGLSYKASNVKIREFIAKARFVIDALVTH